MRWFLQNLQIFLPILFIVITALGPVFKALAEQREQARNRRGGAARPAGEPSDGSETIEAKSPQMQAREEAIEAQRRAQIEMWRAREAMMRGEGRGPVAAPRTAEEELALRRRLAMEELQRRQAAAVRAEQVRQAPAADRPAPARESRRQRAEREAQRQRQAAAAAARIPKPAAQPPQSEVAAAPEAPAPRRAIAPRAPAVVPASRTSGLGSILLTRGALRQALVLKELLDPPLAIRDTPGGSSDGYHQPF